MSRLPTRGPLNQIDSPRMVRDGTTPPTNGATRGPVCSSRPSGIREYTRRVQDVKEALQLGIERYAYAETVAELGSDLKGLVDALWPGFVQALKIYAASIGVGATLFGILGAVLGGGAGAIPGAAIGAEIGFEVGTAILYFMGLKFLLEYILAHLDEANRHFGLGFQQAWGACGDRSTVDHAAREFARGIAAFMSLLLQAAVAWLLKKGLKAGLEELDKSDAGRVLASYAKVEFWRQKLGVTDAPVPRLGIARTIEYFDEQVRKGNLDPAKFTNEKELLSYWKGMDFSKEIKPETLQPGKELVGYRDPAYPYGYYYTDVGVFLDKLGVDYVTQTNLPGGGTALVPREFVRYRVKASVESLKSTSSGVRAWDTGRPVPGGATQYFIPRDLAKNALEIINPPPPKMPLIVPAKKDDSTP